MMCRKCGTRLTTDMQKCPNCGAEVFEALETPEDLISDSTVSAPYMSDDGFIDESLLEEEEFFASGMAEGTSSPWFKPAATSAKAQEDAPAPVTPAVEETPVAQPVEETPVAPAVEETATAPVVEETPIAPEPAAPIVEELPTEPASPRQIVEDIPVTSKEPETEPELVAPLLAEPVFEPVESLPESAPQHAPESAPQQATESAPPPVTEQPAKAQQEKKPIVAQQAKQPAATQQPKQYQQPARPQPTPDTQKKSPFLTILCIILAVIMVVEICVAGFWKPGWFRSAEENSPEPTSVSGQNQAQNIPKDEISIDQPVVEQHTVTVDAGCFNLEGKQLTAKVEDKGTGKTDDGKEYHQFDISLGDQLEFDDPVLLRFPSDDPEHTVVTHYDQATDSWIPLATYEDKENGGVYVLTRSCSPFRVEYSEEGPLYVVTGKGTPDARLVLSSNWKNILFKTADPLYADTIKNVSSLKKDFVIEVPEVEEDRTPEQAMDAFNEASGWWSLIAPLIDVSVGLVPMEKAPVDIVLVNGKFAPFQNTFRADLAEAMTDISILTMGLQVISDSYQYGFESETTALNAYKNLMTNAGTFYSMWTGYGSPALTLGFLGVTVFSMQLDYMISSAKDTQLEISTNVFNSYYKNIHPFDWHYWYDLYVNSFWQSNMDFNAAMDKVNEGIDEYCNEFWELSKDTSNEDFIFAVAESNYKNFFELTDEQKKQLTAELKIYIRRRFVKEALPKIERFVMERTEEQLRKKCASVVEPFNRELCIRIEETVDLTTSQVPQYRGCVLAFGKGDTIITNDGWTLETPKEDADTDDGWSMDFNCTDYAWMCANLPDTLYVYASKSDMKKKAKPLLKVPFDLETSQSKNRTTVINLSDTNTYGWTLTKLSINPNYEPGDPERVIEWSGDTTQIVVKWKETVDEVEKEYSDITASFGDYADFPEEFQYATYYDSEVNSPSARSQDANASAKINGKTKKLAKEAYYPEGYNGHLFKGDKVIQMAEEGKTMTVTINRGIYSLVYQYKAIPAEEKGTVEPKIVNNCKNGFEVKDFLGKWVTHVEENGKSYNGYAVLTLEGKQIRLKLYDDLSKGSSVVLDYKLIDGKTLRISKMVDDEKRWIDVVMKDKDHITMTNNKNDEKLSFTRSSDS